MHEILPSNLMHIFFTNSGAEAEWDGMYQQNLKAPVMMCQATFLTALIEPSKMNIPIFDARSASRHPR